MYATTCVFLVAVTPANFVSDPYTIYWVKSHGVSTSKASALTACNALLWEIAQLIITMPSLIWMCVRWQDIFGNNAYDSAAGRLVFIFMFIGITVDFVGLAVMLIVGFNRKLHYSLSRLFNRVKKFLHLSYHTKEQTYQTYVVEAKLQREFILLLKMWKSSIAILIVVFFTEVYLYVAVFLSVRFIANATYTLSFWEIFNVANVTTTANRFVPLPGNELSIEWIMKEFMYTKIGGITADPNVHNRADIEKLVDHSIIIWRCWTSYFPAIIGVFGFGSLTATQIKQYRLKHKK